MSCYDSFPSLQPNRLSAVEDLLSRYPMISRNEMEEVASFLRTASILDIYLLRANQSLDSRLAQFRNDNGADLSLQKADYVALAVISTIIATILILYF